ncbi:outer membrane lipid asymmetry maintenance protein MlaD [Acetobacter oeni]|uniref:Outer membrane lipid asymmetry maintenance protein MlaD n=2 Tax=Acetobacter oeni TaxID=304077 RepID=A0A511XHN8_9PROT|nr:MlaD family protein [Acetobacter oeni]MBB3881308.1 phospholipid/cholesterol/gamma-HCH transport system substrate-binding protein [Acetobacter oeni]NHO18181.1 MCE family protein [Acetobacter oeni]GBR08022.1 toluene ABC transporter periplasmic protein [Acetobacter oeni LMG 21952]GEN62463.1 outer membrane lipid asymmetry maintenance protein MlaD [Acetobacter oeni]
MGHSREAGTIVFSFAVLAVTAGFTLYARSTQTDHGAPRYPLSAEFVSANGLKRGADVDIGGVPVGRVSDIHLDTKTAMAVVRFEVNDTLHFPTDSILSVGSATMSGDNALMIEPGTSQQLTKAGDVLANTREPTSLEQQVSNYIFGNGGLPPE